MNSEHETKGPWIRQNNLILGAPDKRSKHPHGRPIIAMLCDEKEKLTTRLSNGRLDNQAQADGNLMAAAPRLRDALDMAMEAIEYFHEHEGAGITLRAARAALAQARGENQANG